MQAFAVYMRFLRSISAPLPLSSDTLFGAVCWGISQLGLRSDLADWLRGFSLDQRPGPFTFSSAYPVFFDESNRPSVRFFPLLESFTLTTDDFESLVENYQSDPGCAEEYRKKGFKLTSCTNKQARAQISALWKRIRKTRFVSAGLLDLLASSQIHARDIVTDLLHEGDEYVHIWDALMTMQEYKQLMKAGFNSQRPAFIDEAVQHNQIDRLFGSTVEGALFYDREVYFVERVGLWAILLADPDEFDNFLLPALRYLADSGLGANRSTGKGHFWLDVKPAPSLPSVNDANAVLMLSSYLPAPDEDIAVPGPIAYRLLTIRAKREQKYLPSSGGDAASPPIYKQALRVFAPGSVFPLKPKTVYGRLVQVVPDDQGGPVFQNCAALGLPIFVKETK